MFITALDRGHRQEKEWASSLAELGRGMERAAARATSVSNAARRARKPNGFPPHIDDGGERTPPVPRFRRGSALTWCPVWRAEGP